MDNYYVDFKNNLLFTRGFFNGYRPKKQLNLVTGLQQFHESVMFIRL